MNKYGEFADKILSESISWFWWLYDTQQALEIYSRLRSQQEDGELSIFLKYKYLFEEGICLNNIRRPLYQLKIKAILKGGK